MPRKRGEGCDREVKGTEDVKEDTGRGDMLRLLYKGKEYCVKVMSEGCKVVMKD